VDSRRQEEDCCASHYVKSLLRNKNFIEKENIAISTQVFISVSGSGHPCPYEPQTQLLTLKTEGHTRTVTLL